MKALAIRFFALFVAIAGLASASLAPATSQARISHNSVAATDPGPLVTFPGLSPAGQLTPASRRPHQPSRGTQGRWIPGARGAPS
jgi:hypothetical protein